MQPLEAAWVRLPPLHRAIVALRLPLGRSYEEIGAILAMPEEAVMGRLRRARQSLRCVLVAPQAAATEGPSRDCPRIREWLDAYLDRELASTDRRRIERHREECAPCREYLRDVESIERALLDRWRAEEPPRAELDAWAKRFAARPDLEAARRAWRIEPKRPWIRRLLRP